MILAAALLVHSKVAFLLPPAIRLSRPVRGIYAGLIRLKAGQGRIDAG